MNAKRESNTFFFTFGRYNPPTIGHERLFDRLKEVSDGNEFSIIPTRTQDKKKNPLEVSHKITILKKLFPHYSENILDVSSLKTIIDVLKYAEVQGYEDIQLIVGSDRVDDFTSLLQKYNGKEYQFKNINVLSAGERDPDGDGVSGISATKMRHFAVIGDIESFKQGIPPNIDDKDVNSMIKLIQEGLNS